MRKILLVNDDGYQAAGIRALYRDLTKHFEVTAVAPKHEQSWMGKSITSRRELTMEQVKIKDYDGFAIDGTPADCTQIGIHDVLSTKPDAVVSGINNGANIGYSHILSSGTVGAALEAGLQGIPSFATSVWRMRKDHPGANYDDEKFVDILANSAEITRKIVLKILDKGYPSGVQTICINMPYNVKIDAPWVITKPHDVNYGYLFTGTDGKFKNHGGSELVDSDDAQTDLAALAKGYVSIMPIKIALTSQSEQKQLAKILEIDL